MLLAGCATAASSMSEAAVDGEARVFATLPTDFAPVQVGDAEFSAAMAGLVLEMPLRVAPASMPMRPGRRYALAVAALVGPGCQQELARSYGRFCERRGTPGDCLSLFEDGSCLQDDDKRRIALALAVEPALEGVNAELRTMLDPTRVAAVASITITAYMALLVAPEPVSKGVATAFVILMWSYLGTEMWGLIEGWMALSEESARATTFAELREVGERFGQRIGPNSVRILVMVGTAAVGETAALLTRAPNLPGFAQASIRGAQQGGVRVLAAAAETERVIVSVAEGTIRVVLPANAIAMSGGKPSSKEGKLLPNGHRAFKSYKDFKAYMGKAGKGKQWHHIIEQCNVERFGAEAIHNTENVIALDAKLHERISAFYSSRQEISGDMVVREWLRTQSYERHRAFGLMVLRQFGGIP
ncbi:putative lipoprotein [Archangium gephyra]|uniref:Lipoprotein n=1 Tax=Archangium gephyra TaxID=48 RepID=A0AAC8Q4A5_9BACT|nr:putative lipoprotein [Archangium gephyra]